MDNLIPVDWSPRSEFVNVVERLILQSSRHWESDTIDALSDVWINLEKVYPSGASVDPEAPLLRKIVRRKVSSFYQKEKKKKQKFQSLGSFSDVQQCVFEDDPSRAIIEAENRIILERGFDQLSQEQADLIRARFQLVNSRPAEGIFGNRNYSSRHLRRLTDEAVKRLKANCTVQGPIGATP